MRAITPFLCVCAQKQTKEGLCDSCDATHTGHAVQEGSVAVGTKGLPPVRLQTNSDFADGVFGEF